MGRRHGELASDKFKIPGAVAAFRLRFWPKGAAGASRGKCSIAVWSGQGATQVDTRVMFQLTEEWRWTDLSPPLLEESDQEITDYRDTPRGDVTIVVKRTMLTNAGARVVCLKVGYDGG